MEPHSCIAIKGGGRPPLCGTLCGYVAIWLCDSVAMWLSSYVAIWLCGYVDKFQKSKRVPFLKIENLPNFYFMFFDRYEIHIQAFLDCVKPIFMFFSDPHLHKIILRICTQHPQKTERIKQHGT